MRPTAIECPGWAGVKTECSGIADRPTGALRWPPWIRLIERQPTAARRDASAASLGPAPDLGETERRAWRAGWRLGHEEAQNWHAEWEAGVLAYGRGAPRKTA